MLDLFIFSLLLSPVIGSHLTGSSTWFHHTSFYLSDRKFHNSPKPRISQVFVLDFLKFSSQHKWWNRIEQNRIEDVFIVPQWGHCSLPATYALKMTTLQRGRCCSWGRLYLAKMLRYTVWCLWGGGEPALALLPALSMPQPSAGGAAQGLHRVVSGWEEGVQILVHGSL